MPQESQLAHRVLTNLALPYITNVSPANTDPHYVFGSTDILTSINGYAERRPGFATAVESTPTVFNNLQRLFTWDRFDGTFFDIACDVNASGFAQVFKLQNGVDLSFVSIFTDTVGTPFDFVVSNNTIYFSNGNVAKKWDPVNGLSNWGIAIGSVNNATGPALAGAGANLNDGTNVAWVTPNNVTSAVSFATASVLSGFLTQYDQATTFGFSIPTTNTITGIKVSVNAKQSAVNTASVLAVQLLKAGNGTGTIKSTVGITTGSTAFTFGGTSDLWGGTWVPNDINQTSFGVQVRMLNPSGPNETFSINNVQITVYGLGGPTLVQSGSGTFSASSGYTYEFCYGNSNTGHISSPTPASISTGPFGGAISTSTLAASGTGYAANDTGIIVAGNSNATYKILTVSGSAVLTYSITAAGNGYTAANNIKTAPGGAQPGAGSGFTINITAITGVANIQISLTASTDPQVNQIRVFRTTDGGGGTFFELPTSPYPNTTATVNDNAADAALTVSSVAPIITFNDPPTPFRAMVYFSGRIWGFTGNKVWFSGLEEITQGVPEESFPSGVAGNFWSFDEPVQGLGVAGIGNNQTLLIFCGGRIFGIQGNTLDTFRRFLISNRRGARNLTCITSLGGMVSWLDSSNQVWATDGSSLEELSTLIRPDLATLTQANCSMSFHTAGRFHWLVLSTGSLLYVYDVDQDQWMPPWTFSAKYIYSGEISAGNYVLMASNGTKALQLNPAAFNDNGVTYAPVLKTNLLSVIPDYGTRFSYIGTGSYNEPTRTGYPAIFQLTNNGQAINDFLICNDEDTRFATYTSISTGLVDTAVAFNRANGLHLQQLVYPTTQPAARWIGVKVILINGDQVDNLYELFLAYKPLGGR